MFGGSDPFGSFGMFNFIFYGVFFLVIGMFAVILISIVLGWFKNQRSPLIEVQAKVVAKRDHTSIHSRNRSTSSINTYSSFTTYYVTFQFDTGDRVELKVPYDEFGLLIEGDSGKLKFQGTRFIQFERL
ncbi:MAG TPA: DUF2500 domain-containing protein [Petrotogaceae bacterium]|nr:DUF2500 domain-containing protein [Petrotogaceae bacterium]HPA93588.1 DUF2500 domain-containing protein [Petrotogaceae bacterium]HQO13331.1 DUF2500 domain-containing protein [Petrotogaceae bacterium]HQP59428.1 DUF2500 domain-containing protein [Petrotogaceae bacterium]